MSEDNFRTRVKQDLIKNKVIVEHHVCASFSNELLCSEDEHLLRYWLWRKHAVDPLLYGDDGEMQCNTCGIAFKRDTVKIIDGKLQKNYTDWLVEHADEIKERLNARKLNA